MDPTVIAAGISSAGNLLGGLLGGSNNHAGRDARQQLDYAIEQSVLGKVKAAKKAGISPLYALGAPVMSSSWTPASGSDPGLGGALASMGQDISRAVATRQTEPERQLQALTLEKAGLENEYLRSQIASIRANTSRQVVGPPAPGMIPEQVQLSQRTIGANFLGPWESNPYVSDWGQYLEDRVGDDNPVTWPVGAAVLGADVYWNSQLRRAINEIASGKSGTGGFGSTALGQILGY